MKCKSISVSPLYNNIDTTITTMTATNVEDKDRDREEEGRDKSVECKVFL